MEQDTAHSGVSWKTIPPGSVCEVDGCSAPAEHVHHTLRPRYSALVAGPNGIPINERNKREWLQHLCEKHHAHEGHELFSSSGSWPEDFGHPDMPFRRNCPRVEALIVAAVKARQDG